MNEEKRTLLAVLAHPDDESFGVGGTLALYAGAGVDVHLACATRGEAGEVDDEFLRDFGSIAERRTSELHCAAEKLRLSGVHFLGYRDSGMTGSAANQHPEALASAPEGEVAGKIADLIRELKPQVMLTFDPIGGYRHPDHIAIHNATVRAFSQAGDHDYVSDLPPYQAQKLYFQIFPKRLLRFALFVMRLLGKDPRRFGRNQDIDLASLLEDGEFKPHARIDFSEVMGRKQAATLCHASQLEGSGQGLGFMRWVERLFARNEYFMRAFPPPEPGLLERDLFAGVSASSPAAGSASPEQATRSTAPVYGSD